MHNSRIPANDFLFSPIIMALQAVRIIILHPFPWRAPGSLFHLTGKCCVSTCNHNANQNAHAGVEEVIVSRNLLLCNRVRNICVFDGVGNGELKLRGCNLSRVEITRTQLALSRVDHEQALSKSTDEIFKIGRKIDSFLLEGRRGSFDSKNSMIKGTNRITFLMLKHPLCTTKDHTKVSQSYRTVV